MDPGLIISAGKFGLSKGISHAINVVLLRHKKKIREELVAKLGKGGTSFDPEILKTKDEFVYFFALTLDAAERAAAREKIWLLASLLRSALYYEHLSERAEYEDYLKIVDELSLREMVLLHILQKYELATPLQDGENSTQRASRLWEAFMTEATSRFGVPKEEITAMLVRIVRTGCYDYDQGGFGGNSEKHGGLTPIYYKLIRLLTPESGVLDEIIG